MNARTLTAAALALVALSTGAFAQEADSDAWMQVASTRTRADVQRDLNQARADGSIRFGRTGYLETVRSTRSRDEVRAEVLAARTSGELAAINAEVHAWVPAPNVQLARAGR